MLSGRTYNRTEQTLDGRVLVRVVHIRRTTSFEVAAICSGLERVVATTDSAIDTKLRKTKVSTFRFRVGVAMIIQR
jgi:hypothetical protein